MIEIPAAGAQKGTVLEEGHGVGVGVNGDARRSVVHQQALHGLLLAVREVAVASRLQGNRVVLATGLLLRGRRERREREDVLARKERKIQAKIELPREEFSNLVQCSSRAHSWHW